MATGRVVNDKIVRDSEMGKRDDLIVRYADDLKNKCGLTPDMDLLSPT